MISNIKCWAGVCSTTFRSLLNPLRPRRNRRQFSDDIFKCTFLKGNVLISIDISPKFIPKGPINNIPELGLIMAWYRPGHKPLSEPMMIISLTYIYINQPQWVKVNLIVNQLCVLETHTTKVSLMVYYLIHMCIYKSVNYDIIASDNGWGPQWFIWYKCHREYKYLFAVATWRHAMESISASLAPPVTSHCHVDSLHKGPTKQALMLSLMLGLINLRFASDLRSYDTHCGVIVMQLYFSPVSMKRWLICYVSGGLMGSNLSHCWYPA